MQKTFPPFEKGCREGFPGRPFQTIEPIYVPPFRQRPSIFSSFHPIEFPLYFMGAGLGCCTSAIVKAVRKMEREDYRY